MDLVYTETDLKINKLLVCTTEMDLNRPKHNNNQQQHKKHWSDYMNTKKREKNNREFAPAGIFCTHISNDSNALSNESLTFPKWE